MRVLLVGALAILGGPGPALAADSITGTFTVRGQPHQFKHVYVERATAPPEPGAVIRVVMSDVPLPPDSRYAHALDDLSSKKKVHAIHVAWTEGAQDLVVMAFHDGVIKDSVATDRVDMDLQAYDGKRIKATFKTRALGQSSWHFKAEISADVTSITLQDEPTSASPAEEGAPKGAAASSARETKANPEDAALEAKIGKRRLGQLGYAFTEDAFGHALLDGNDEAVRLFLRLGMSANYQHARGGPALVMAAASCQREPEEGRLDILHALLEAKATVDAKTEHDVTPLLRAVIAGCPVEFIEALVRAGANVNVKTKTGFSVLSIAEERGYDDIVNVLRKAGARE